MTAVRVFMHNCHSDPLSRVNWRSKFAKVAGTSTATREETFFLFPTAAQQMPSGIQMKSFIAVNIAGWLTQKKKRKVSS